MGQDHGQSCTEPAPGIGIGAVGWGRRVVGRGKNSSAAAAGECVSHRGLRAGALSISVLLSSSWGSLCRLLAAPGFKS